MILDPVVDLLLGPRELLGQSYCIVVYSKGCTLTEFFRKCFKKFGHLWSVFKLIMEKITRGSFWKCASFILNVSFEIIIEILLDQAMDCTDNSIKFYPIEFYNYNAVNTVATTVACTKQFINIQYCIYKTEVKSQYTHCTSCKLRTNKMFSQHRIRRKYCHYSIARMIRRFKNISLVILIVVGVSRWILNFTIG